MEKQPSVWIDDEVERNMPLCLTSKMEKTRTICNPIQTEISHMKDNTGLHLNKSYMMI